ncbi:Poly(A) RNA polymerase cid13 [Orobanche gracilis]
MEKKTNGGSDEGDGFKMEMGYLEEMLSKLNPMAEEFVPLNAALQHNFLVAPSHVAAVGHFG